MLTWPLNTNFSGILIDIDIFFIPQNVFRNVVWKMAAILSQPQCDNGILPCYSYVIPLYTLSAIIRYSSLQAGNECTNMPSCQCIILLYIYILDCVFYMVFHLELV